MKHNFYVSTENIIFNIVHAKAGHIINFFTLVAKFTIFRSKCAGTVPNSHMLLQEINLIHQIEKFIASKNHTLNKHNLKWTPYVELLQVHPNLL